MSGLKKSEKSLKHCLIKPPEKIARNLSPVLDKEHLGNEGNRSTFR